MLKLKANGVTHELLEIGEVLIPNLYSGTKDFSGSRWLGLEPYDLSTKQDGFTVAKKTGAWGGLGQIMEVKTGEVYRLSAMIRLTGAHIDSYATIESQTPQCKFTKVTQVNQNSSAWQKCVGIFTITEGGKATFRFENTADAGTVEIYAMHLCRVKSAGEASYWSE